MPRFMYSDRGRSRSRSRSRSTDRRQSTRTQSPTRYLSGKGRNIREDSMDFKIKDRQVESPRRRASPRSRVRSSQSPIRRYGRSRSPRRKSRSPRRKSRSPRRKSRSPRRKSRSPRRNRSRELRDDRVTSSSSVVESNRPMGYVKDSRQPQQQARALQALHGDRLKRSPGGDDDDEKIPLILPRDIIKHYTPTEMSCHERFLFGQPSKRIVPSENIAVGIERQIRGNSPAVIRRELRPSEVVLRRRREEGEVALCERDEFSRQSGDVDEPERRVIRVTDRNMIHQDYSSSRTASVKYSERHDDRLSVHDRVGSQSSSVHSRVGSRRDSRHSDNPRDLRHNLQRKRLDSGDRSGSRLEGRDRSLDDRARLGPRSSIGLKDRDRGRDRDGRERSKRAGSKEELPDFSKRPERYQSNDWKTQPEIIPRSGYYFEHDNRDEPGNYRGGGRGRGWRGRGGGGGSRGWVRNKSPEREWKHDKFMNFDNDEEEKPSSTSEN